MPRLPKLVALILLVWGGCTFRAAASDVSGRVIVRRVAGVANVVKAQRDAADGPRYTWSRDGGVTFSPAIPIVAAAARKPGLKFTGADLAVGGDGRVYVALANNAWQLRLPQDEWSLYYASLAPGAKAFSPVRNLNRKSSEGFSLAADERLRHRLFPFGQALCHDFARPR